MIEITGELRERWNKTILEILAFFIDICEKEGLIYYVAYGSALGALRHGGIIPWDDDIDVVMPRPDYERFKEYCDKTNTGKYRLYHPGVSDDFYVSFFKFVDSTTTLKERDNQKIEIGLYMDIFPLDGCDENNNVFLKTFWKIKKSYLYMFREASLNAGLISGFRNLVKGKLKFFIRSLLIALNRNYWRNWAIRRINRIVNKRSFYASDYVANYLGVYGSRERMRKKIFGKGRIVNFEGLQVRVPSQCEQYLVNLYGDWKTMPPIEERKTHHLISYVCFKDEEKTT